MKRKMILLLVVLVVVAAILTLYQAERNKYQNVFCKNTIINGEDCSGCTVEEVRTMLQNKQEQYQLEIVFNDNEILHIDGADIGIMLNNSSEEHLVSIKKQQRKDFFLRGGTYFIDGFSFNEEKLRSLLFNDKHLQHEYMEKMTEKEYVYDFDTKSFQIQIYKPYYLNFDEVLSEVSKAVKEKQTMILLENLYFCPREDDYVNNLNKMINHQINYKLPSGEEFILDSNTLYTWLVQDDEGKYIKDEEFWNQNIETFVEQLSELVNTVGKTKVFKPTGMEEKVSIRSLGYGYKLDEQAEINQLKQDLEEQTMVTRKPCYANVEVSTENDGLGNSYVEIDLTRQKVWVYVDGKLEIETDCVTGCVATAHATPTGIFTLAYKEKDRVLRGKKLDNGEYEYESLVSYWMPFNGGIGLHDATWRNAFGGEIYINNGSHGCINLPLKAAEKLYWLINDKMPIIVY